MRLAVIPVVILLTAAVHVRAGEIYKYRDRWGMTHVVDSLEKVPPEYRESAKPASETRRGSMNVENPIQPGASAAAKTGPQGPVANPAGDPGTGKPPQGGRGPDYPVARLRVSGTAESLGSWQSSRIEFRGNPYYVIVAASWCPRCMELFQEISTHPKMKARISGVLFYESEAESVAKKQGGSAGESHLSDPDELNRFSLPYYLIRKKQFGDIVKGYPSMLECSSDGCKHISAWDWVEENK